MSSWLQSGSSFYLCDLRFRWRRRLFVISAPNDEEWAYQQQLYALSSQACNLGMSHLQYSSKTLTYYSFEFLALFQFWIWVYFTCLFCKKKEFLVSVSVLVFSLSHIVIPHWTCFLLTSFAVFAMLKLHRSRRCSVKLALLKYFSKESNYRLFFMHRKHKKKCFWCKTVKV